MRRRTLSIGLLTLALTAPTANAGQHLTLERLNHRHLADATRITNLERRVNKLVAAFTAETAARRQLRREYDNLVNCLDTITVARFGSPAHRSGYLYRAHGTTAYATGLDMVDDNARGFHLVTLRKPCDGPIGGGMTFPPDQPIAAVVEP